MSQRLYVATRKGLFSLKRKTGPVPGWAIEQVYFLGEHVSMVLPDRRDGTLYAALHSRDSGVKLHRTSDRGQSWDECTTPAFPKAGKGEAKGSPSLRMIWSLEGAGKDKAGELWAGTIPGGLFHSGTRGDTWTFVRSLWARPEREAWTGGGFGEPGIHSICVDPRDSRRVLIGVSVGGVWLTEDSGQTWALRATGMFADDVPAEQSKDPNLQDPHRIVQCPSNPDMLWCQHHNGVFRSVDGGLAWTEVPAVKPSVFGFSVAVHPKDPETAWFVPTMKDECRVPEKGKVSVARTRDGGAKFTVLREGLPQKHAYDLVYRHGLDVDDTGDRLAVGSTTGSLWISEDQGETWATVSANLPPICCVRFEK